jgi:glycerol uptake facilitator-like aquaporin
MDKDFRGYFAELLGTFALVFISAGTVCATQVAVGSNVVTPVDPVVLLMIALAAGFVYAAALAFTLPFSTGYLNPAITLMLWVFKRLDGAKTLGLIFCQFLGAVAAGGILRFVLPDEYLARARLGTPHLNLQGFGVYPNLQGVFDGGEPSRGILIRGVAIELVLTFILTLVVFGTIMDPRVHRLLGLTGRRLIGLWVGLVLVAITLMAFPLTGAAVNPARWFGTVIWEQWVPALQAQRPFADHVVYWFGPIAGALLAGVAYSAVILPADVEHVASTPATTTKATTGAGATLFRSKK